ncbi:MAG: chromosome segregation SMC family protein, partial [Alphaproteobacteria bacterium]
MRFTRLRLSGFKSFVEPAELRIEPGLTGIVGPNGCGKSNLVEALGWVMGEGSARQMRASGMDDVIFAGSAGRPSRNMAEVGLFIDNTSRTAPAHLNNADQLEITRRIEREAGSIYRINGRDVLARDVSLLFADAASGPRSTAIVRQGRIGALINAKPKERRAILEEAAGISGLHSRRHEAELRLRAAETNLTRLDDIMAQLETQIAALKRQARQAQRYRNLSETIRHGEALLFHLRWQETVSAIARAAGLLEQAETRVADAARDAAAASTAQLQAAEAVPPLRQSEAEAAAALHRLSVARDGLEAEAARIALQTARSENALAQLQLDQARETAQERDAQNALQQLAAERSALEQAQTDQHGRGDALRDDAALAAAVLKTSETALDTAVRHLADLTARRESLSREASQTRTRFERLTQQLAAVASERTALQAQLPAAPRIAEIEQVAITARAEVTAARETVTIAEARREATQKTEAAEREIFQSARTAADKLAAEEQALSRLLTDRGSDLWPPLVDALRVTPGYETALGAALGDDLDYPSDDSAPVHWALLAGDGPLPALPAGAQALDRYVTGAPARARRLSQIGVVTAADGIFLRAQLKPGQRLVSREGALWRWDGFTAAADAPSAAAKRLE